MRSMRRTLRGPSELRKKTTELRSAVSITFRNDVGKRNPYQSKIRRPQPEPMPALVSSSVYNTSYLSMAVKAMC
jgi:hypothetical protein